jgi:hypothetical protein
LFFSLGTLVFGLIDLIGNFICFLLLFRFDSSHHSYVEYLRALSFFDFVALCYEFIQSLNDLTNYLFSKNFLNFRFSFLCKFYDYSKYSIVLLSCWTIVSLAIDRCILVCNPWPKLSRRVCNSTCAKRIIFLLVFLSFSINIPHFIYKEWFCRPTGFQYSAIYNHKFDLNQTKQICSCRISPLLKSDKKKFFSILAELYISSVMLYNNSSYNINS